VRRRPETRKEFEADPGAFALKVVAFKNTQRRSSRPRALARPEVPETRKAPRKQKFAKHGRRGREGDRDPVCVR